jgi:dTMP kinase
MKKYKGIFITFEGIDGCGKSTQARRLYTYLKKSGYPVLFLREPGGTPASERMRRVLLDRNLEITPTSELLLYEAARAQLAETVIIPELKKGTIIVCDRYYDSTTAYQGFGRRLDLRMIERLNRIASQDVAPDLTFIFDIDYKTALTRRDGQADRLEKEKQAFFNRVRKGFQTLASKRRVILLDGRRDIITLSKQVRECSLRLISRRNKRSAH